MFSITLERISTGQHWLAMRIGQDTETKARAEAERAIAGQPDVRIAEIVREPESEEPLRGEMFPIMGITLPPPQPTCRRQR